MTQAESDPAAAQVRGVSLTPDCAAVDVCLRR